MEWISVRHRLPYIDYAHNQKYVRVLTLNKYGVVSELFFRHVSDTYGHLYGIFHTPYGRWKVKYPTHWIQVKESPL